MMKKGKLRNQRIDSVGPTSYTSQRSASTLSSAAALRNLN